MIQRWLPPTGAIRESETEAATPFLTWQLEASLNSLLEKLLKNVTLCRRLATTDRQRNDVL